MIGENEIVELLKVSRTTVRSALNQLVKEGYIVRYQGKGSFISEPKLKRDINYLYNFTQNIREAGSVPSSQVLQCQVIPATAELQEAMKLAAVGQKVFILERLRMADGEPLILETTYIPYYLCEGIESTDFPRRLYTPPWKTATGSSSARGGDPGSHGDPETCRPSQRLGRL